MSQFQSSGRGGAGNIVDSSKAQQLQPQDLQTPTLKTSMVTTGRGGTGNFASGLDADEKRRRQDVVPYAFPPSPSPNAHPPPRKQKTNPPFSVVRRDSHGATHVGRGGTGNVATPPPPLSPQLAPVTSATSDSNNTNNRLPSPTAATAMENLRRERSRASTTGRGAGNDEEDDVAVPARKPEEMGWAERGMNLLFGRK